MNTEQFIKIKDAYDAILEDFNAPKIDSNSSSNQMSPEELEKSLHMDRIRQKIEQEMELKRQEQRIKEAEELKIREEKEKARELFR